MLPDMQSGRDVDGSLFRSARIVTGEEFAGGLALRHGGGGNKDGGHGTGWGGAGAGSVGICGF